MTQARYGSKFWAMLPKGLVQSQIPAMTIGDPVGVAAAEPVDDWLVEPVEDWLVEPVDCWLPAAAVVGLLDDVLLLDEQAASTSAATPTQRTRLNGRKSVIFPPLSRYRTPLR